MNDSTSTELRPPLEPQALSVRAVLLALDPANSSGAAALASVLRELPEPETFPDGSWVAVATPAPARPGFVARLFGKRAAPGASLSARCTALLARGYERVCASNDIAFGRVPERR